MRDDLLALSPLDGRYADETRALREYFSEFAITRGRVRTEIAYLMALSREAGLIRTLTANEIDILNLVAQQFSLGDAQENKDFERVTRHDVKAVESFLRAKLAPTSLADLVEFLHFGLTSEDVNNIAQAIALRDAREKVVLPAIDWVIESLVHLARTYRSALMLARTHGQPALPTTFGKEMAVFLVRLNRQRRALAMHSFLAKLTGGVGNFNALQAAAPQVDWLTFSEQFVRSLGLEPEAVTTQILPYDNWIEYFQLLMQTNSILIGLCKDIWQYIGDGYLRLKTQPAEAGSSTMPQKVNPIDFENAEGNLGIANALLEHYARKLPITRLQRDLSDSTVRRTFGSALGHALVGYTALRRGLALIEVDEDAMKAALQAHWEVVAEGAQTILRTAAVKNPYDLLKELTRGKALTQETYERWIDELKVPEGVKSRLRGLSPLTYTGLAEQIVERALQGLPGTPALAPGASLNTDTR
jgi:adenylosuccinate lyase